MRNKSKQRKKLKLRNIQEVNEHQIKNKRGPLPIIIVCITEIQELLSKKDGDTKEIAALIKDILTGGRSDGVYIWMDGQSIYQSRIPLLGEVLNNLQNRMSMWNPKNTEAFFGPDVHVGIQNLAPVGDAIMVQGNATPVNIATLDTPTQEIKVVLKSL